MRHPGLTKLNMASLPYCPYRNTIFSKQQRDLSQDLSEQYSQTLVCGVLILTLNPFYSLPGIVLPEGKFAREGKFSRYEPGRRIETTCKRMK